MKHINEYATAAAYAADTNRPTTLSTVSNVADGTGVKFEGKNILVLKAGAGVGDIVVYDKTTSLIKYLKLDTYNAATLPASIVTMGVVYDRTGNTVRIVSKTAATSAAWGAPYRFKLSGFDLATGGTFTVTINATTTGTITYTSADTLTSIAVLVMAALQAAGFTAATGWTCTAFVANTCVVVQRDYYTPAISTVAVTDASAKITRALLTPADYQATLSGLVTPYGSITRKDGGVTSYAGCNYAKFYDYFYTSGSADTAQTVGALTIIKNSVFNSTDNPLLVTYYGTYAAYIQDKMLAYPWAKNVIRNDTGMADTTLLAAVLYTDQDATTKPAFPAAYNAKTFGVVVTGYTTGLEAGAWWLPSIRELYLLMRDVNLASTDAVNRSLTAVGGSALPASGYYPWSCAESGSYVAWLYYGISGGMLISRKVNAGYVRPVSAF